MDDKKFKDKFLWLLKDDISFRHAVLNILADDLNDMIEVETDSSEFPSRVTSVDVAVCEIDEETTRSEEVSKINRTLGDLFSKAYKRFPVKKRNKETHCRKVYIKYLTAVIDSAHVSDLHGKVKYAEWQINVLIGQKLEWVKDIKADAFFDNLEKGEYKDDLDEIDELYGNKLRTWDPSRL